LVLAVKTHNDIDVDRLIKVFSEESSRLGVDYADLRIERVRFNRIELREGVLTTVSGMDYGLAVRVYHNGAFGFAFSSVLNVESIRRALANAYSMAKSARSKLPKPFLFESAESYYEHPVHESIENVPIDTKARDLLELDKLLSEKPFVRSRTVYYYEAVEERYYASTEDRRLGERRELVYIAASVFGQQEGVRGSSIVTNGTIKGYYLWRKMSIEEFAEKALQRLESQLKAKPPKSGNFPVVLAPETVGVFVHEAFGHLAEADLVAAGSALQGKKGQEVAAPIVTIVDDPSIDDGFGTLRYDDEGVKTAKAVIVENGVHKQVMTDRVHATLLDEEPTGNARAESFRYPPIVRMRNTIMLPGDATFEEMLEDIEFGYYIVSTAGGQTNLDGSFQVGVREAYEIVNGELGAPVRNLSITGNTLETLRNIDMVGKDFRLFYGRCGKGQVVFVSDGGPHVRVKKMTVGGRA
jgi:TldD protein